MKSYHGFMGLSRETFLIRVHEIGHQKLILTGKRKYDTVQSQLLTAHSRCLLRREMGMDKQTKAPFGMAGKLVHPKAFRTGLA